MKDWKDQTADEFLAWLKNAVRETIEKREAREQAQRKAYAKEQAQPWNHDRDGHRWICIASGHGVETVECTECGVIKDFEV
jgi:CRISPR/Cas system-associated protein Cas10 (large subunit of type III CRISPR-Cas system)